MAVIEIEIGVHSGLMNVGNMGSEFRMAYTVLGDNVNLDLVEGLTKIYGVDLVCTEYRRFSSEFFIEKLIKSGLRVRNSGYPF